MCADVLLHPRQLLCRDCALLVRAPPLHIASLLDGHSPDVLSSPTHPPPPCRPAPAVGIEDVDDLIADLDQAFHKAAAAAAAKGQQQAARQSAYEP